MRSLELKAPPVPLTAVFAAAMFGVSTVTPAATFIPGRAGIAIGLAQFQIKPEERTLLAKFGPAFSQYLAAVRRWV
jgi:protein-S-isoprenylcysteine O-methyltransferase Ste14